MNLFSKEAKIKKHITYGYKNIEEVNGCSKVEIFNELKILLTNNEFLQSKNKAKRFVSLLMHISKSSLNLNPFLSQVVNTALLLCGYCTEVDTGEGKSLSIALCALCMIIQNEEHQVHIITANEYLAERDCHNHRLLFSYFGISCNFVKTANDLSLKRRIYQSHVLYGDIKTIAVDFLNDKLAMKKNEISQVASKKIAIIDEMDYICLDAARQPIVISSVLSDQNEVYVNIYEIISSLSEDDYEIDPKSRFIGLTEYGVEKLENYFKIIDIYNPENSRLLSLVNACLRSVHLMKIDVDYAIYENKVQVIDSFLGRVIENRRFVDGVQQFIEIKEGVSVSLEAIPLSSISIPCFLESYAFFVGTSGTLVFDEIEIKDIYDKEVVRVESDHKSNRKDLPDVITLTKNDKFIKLIEVVRCTHETGQPILIGTKSVEQCEEISNLLSEYDFPHSVINAKNNFEEAMILSKAGQKGVITVSTIMAGRGTDIVLDPEIKEVGLFVIGVEHFDLRRQDSQIRGRCGRQGDAGSTLFFCSIDEEIGDHELIKKIRSKIVRADFDISEIGVLKHALRSLQAKKEVEGYKERKQLLAFEQITNKQRSIFYAIRDSILRSSDFEFISDFQDEVCLKLDFYESLKKDFPDFYVEGCENRVAFDKKVEEISKSFSSILSGMSEPDIQGEVLNEIKHMSLQTFDQFYQSYFYELSLIEDGIEWRKRASKDVYRELYIETYDRFLFILENIKQSIVYNFFRLQFKCKVTK